MIKIDGCDECIIGRTADALVYDYDKLVAHFIKEFDDFQTAVDWVEFNILCAHYGEQTPVIVELFK